MENAVSQPPTSSRFGRMDAFVLLLMMIWGTNFVILKTAVDVLPPMVINGIRFSVGALALGIIFKINGYKLILPRREWPMLIWLAFQGNALYQFVFLSSLRLTTVANNALIINVMPVWVVLYNAWHLHERLTRRALMGVVVALLGVGVVVVGGKSLEFSGNTLPGDALALLASVIFAVTTLMSLKPYQRNPTPALAFWGVLWGGAFQVLMAIPDILNNGLVGLTPPLLLAILYSGLVSIGVGYLIWNHAVKTLGTRRPAIYTYLEPVIAALAAVVFLGESLTVYLFIGAAMVLMGVLLVQSG
ncbi:MAG TPA: DMT family transporter [Aggregatilineales bacterium]|nr:DMT family transporter [Aggregatilineales bacterium]